MRKVMANAEIGDDVFSEDPSVNELEAEAAAVLGKEVAVYFPTGTQSNLCAILTHCRRGDELLVGKTYHTFKSEAGGASALGGIAFSTLPVQADGSLLASDISAAVRPDNFHDANTRLLGLENTISGRAVPLSQMRLSAEAAREHNLKIHLDGARIFNAAVALKVDVKAIAAVADTVSVCLSKGLGAPVGTVLAANKELEPTIRRNRKQLGGGMRQAGIVAAAGLFALRNNVDRLTEDHRRAADLARELSKLPAKCKLQVSQATNIIYVQPAPEDHASLHAYLKKREILIGNKRPAMRIVTHLGISDACIQATAKAIYQYFDAG